MSKSLASKVRNLVWETETSRCGTAHYLCKHAGGGRVTLASVLPLENGRYLATVIVGGFPDTVLYPQESFDNASEARAWCLAVYTMEAP